VSEVKKYLNLSYYHAINDQLLQTLVNIAKVIGIAKFLKMEFGFRKKHNLLKDKDFGVLEIEQIHLIVKKLQKYFFEEVLTDEEYEKIKKFDIQKYSQRQQKKEEACKSNKSEYI